MKVIGVTLKYFLTVLFLAGSGYFLYTKAEPFLMPPCTEPVRYSLGAIDPRFGIATSTYVSTLTRAASIWNTEAGKTLVVFDAEEGIPVNLVYTEVEKATQLGKSISAEQETYMQAKLLLENLRAEFERMKSSYERSLNSFNQKRDSYDEEIVRWNKQGGAPPDRYAALQNEKQALGEEQQELNNEAKSLNALIEKINTSVSALNAAAKNINVKVNTYNASAGTDYDQGDYVSDKEGKRINIFEYEDTTDLTRVLTHEFGHALGLDHVENPSSIMYSYNLGTGLTLSPEDVSALKALCRID